jgi:hypothetical protein
MSAAVESAPVANSTPTEGATAGAGNEHAASSSQNQEVLASAAEGKSTPYLSPLVREYLVANLPQGGDFILGISRTRPLRES